MSTINFLTCKPHKLGYSSTLLKPFEYPIWVILISLLIITTILIKIMKTYNIRAMTILKIIFAQSVDQLEVRNFGSFLILSSWMLSFIIFKNFYATKLWDSMTFDHYGKVVETIEDLIQSMTNGNIKMIIENHRTSLQHYLKVIL